VSKATSTMSPLGERLVVRGVLSPEQRDAALDYQQAHNIRLGELLISEGLASEAHVWTELAVMWGSPLVDLDQSIVDRECLSHLRPVDAIRLQVVPFHWRRGALWIAAVDPNDEETRSFVSEHVDAPVVWCTAPPAAVRETQLALWGPQLAEAAVATIQDYDPDASAERQLSRPQVKVALTLVAVAIASVIIWRETALTAAMGTVVVAYAVWLAFRTWVIVRGARIGPGQQVDSAELGRLDNLPVYTVLCPIYREATIVSELLWHLETLDYPRAKLDVKLLVEEDDTETRQRLAEIAVPSFCEILVVPGVGPRTKPKACNYGLQFARGEYVVIFDAEDRPEPDQLKKALAIYRRGRSQELQPLGCVQAQLAFHNARQNWLTGWFALEYLSFFRFFLPGLVSLGLPVPLGGTSNHFPIEVLRSVGSWDAFNVTEDADLGVRLHRAGYRTVVVDSVTWEEANSDFVNWVKQRSRWGKGYFVTWTVNMRHPARTRRELGWRGWMSLQLTLAGTYVTAVLNLLLWGLMVGWILLGQPTAIAALFPPGIYYLALLELLLGNFFFLYVTLWCAAESESFGLTRLVLTYPAYWVMISIAMVKAGFQLLTDHVYWEKTTHGLTAQPLGDRTGRRLEIVGRPAPTEPVGVGSARQEPVAHVHPHPETQSPRSAFPPHPGERQRA
jgi:glycosyltransferase XagB